MKIRILCPVCETVSGLAANVGSWQCPRCDHIVAVANPTLGAELNHCVVCSNTELYKKKDFPHGLGMVILIGAFVASTIAYWLYDWWLTWGILLGSAAFDGLLYLWVKDVVVCYRCHGEHRRGIREQQWPPFELTIHERYRQEKLRKEQLQAQGLRTPSDR